MIPKVIHYCWFGGKPQPKIVKKCIASWGKMCPDYEIRRWDETNFDVTMHPFMKAAYENKAWAFVSDYARLKIVYDNGGIYLDTDVELIRNLNDLLTNECFLPIENEPRGLINTGLGFGAIPKNETIKEMLDVYNNVTFQPNNVKEIVCPIYNTKPFLKHGYQCGAQQIQHIKGTTILPTEYFAPLDGRTSELHLTKNTYGIHWASRFWETGMDKWKAKFRMLVGSDICRKIKSLYK